MDRSGAPGVGQEVGAVPEETPGRDPEGEPHQAQPRVPHLRQVRPPRAQLLHDDAHVLLRHIDHQLFVRLEPLAIRSVPGDDPRTRDLELVSLAPHRLHEDGEVQLAPAGDLQRIGRLGLLDLERHVLLQLPEQPVAHLAAGDELPFASREAASCSP